MMQLPQIQMQSQMAKVKMEHAKSTQEIQQPVAEVTIQQPKADLTIDTTPGKLTIDQAQAWSELGLKSTKEIIQTNAQAGKDAVLAGIARKATEGEALMAIENGGNPIVAQAIQNSYDDTRQLGIKFIPSIGAVKEHYQPAHVKVNVQPHKPNINVTVHKPTIQYTPGNIKMSMKEYQNLDIHFKNLFSQIT